VRISSPDGLFDGLCGECETLCDEARGDAAELEEARDETLASVRMPAFDLDYVAPADEDIPF
jgi:hypothetical protein